jgi:murein L,D-transpeptidase YcbB/YkuD
MAVPLSERINQIKINLERRRWQVRSVADDHLHVNMINGSMRLMRKGKVAGRYKLLNHAKLKNLPTFLGNLELVEQTSKNNIRPEISISTANTAGLKPMELIDIFELDDAGAFADAVTQSSNRKIGDKVRLAKPLPVFMTYVTAWATRDGRINFHPDIFKRDQPLYELLTAME